MPNTSRNKEDLFVSSDFEKYKSTGSSSPKKVVERLHEHGEKYKERRQQKDEKQF